MAKTSTPARPYQVVGLQQAESMPVHFDGQTYDLARLSPHETDYLLSQGERFPYLVATPPAIPDTSQSNG